MESIKNVLKYKISNKATINTEENIDLWKVK